MTTKTFGIIIYGDLTPHTKGWGLWMKPHIAIKAKRLFPRAMQNRAGIVMLSDTPEVARDLEWFLDRYPLDPRDAKHQDTAAPEILAYLTKRADEHRATEQAVEDILVHGHRLTGWQEPSRDARPYQTQGADLAWTVKGMILGDDVGLGKTQTGLMLLRDPDTLPALVVTLTHLPRQWERELAAVFPMMKAHIAKTTTPPSTPIDADVIVMNYHKLHGWRDYLTGQVKTVIFDEVQELRKAETNKYIAAAQVADGATWRLGLTATPVYNYGDEVHTIYEVLSPGTLGTRAEFIREWGGRAYGQNMSVKDPSGLGTFLRDQGIMLRRTRAEVQREIPEPIAIMQEIPSNEAVLDDVKGDLASLATMLLDGSADSKERMRMGGEISYKLRQATGVAKAPFVAEFVKLLLESEEKIVLYGWHRAVWDIWLDALSDYNPVMFTGSESPTQKEAARLRFTENPSCRILMMSLRSGAGLDGLQDVASVVVFGELDWSPAMHHQAIGRVARDGQEKSVAAYYLVTGSGSDPDIAQTLEIKRQQSEPIRDPNATLFTTPVLGSSDEGRARLLAKAVLR